MAVDLAGRDRRAAGAESTVPARQPANNSVLPARLLMDIASYVHFLGLLGTGDIGVI
jgi:hypothetical protein